MQHCLGGRSPGQAHNTRDLDLSVWEGGSNRAFNGADLGAEYVHLLALGVGPDPQRAVAVRNATSSPVLGVDDEDPGGGDYDVVDVGRGRRNTEVVEHIPAVARAWVENRRRPPLAYGALFVPLGPCL
jgi:hypothetical protein